MRVLRPTDNSTGAMKSQTFPTISELIDDLHKPLEKSWRVTEGRPIHDDDCHIFGLCRVCTCGLLHHLMADPPVDSWWGEEMVEHQKSIGKLAQLGLGACE